MFDECCILLQLTVSAQTMPQITAGKHLVISVFTSGLSPPPFLMHLVVGAWDTGRGKGGVESGGGGDSSQYSVKPVV